MRWLRKIRKIIDYLPLLWQDEDWDFAYILRMLQYKLQRTRNAIESNDIVESAPEISEQIRIAEDAIERLLVDDYAPELCAAIEQKYGEYVRPYSALQRRLVTPENELEYQRELVQYSEEAQRLRQQDLDLLFRQLRDHIEGWWD